MPAPGAPGAGTRRLPRAAVAAGVVGAVLAALAVIVALGAAGSDASHPAGRPLAPARPGGAAGSPAAFGLSLMRHLGGGNLVFSPDSVAVALAMAGEGATGATAAQIAHALGLGSPAGFAALGRLQATLAAEQAAAGAGAKRPVDLQTGDGLFAQQGLTLFAPFKASLASNFGAVPDSVDFRNNMPGAVHTINAWIAEQTHGLLPHVLSSLPTATVLALVNAIYLKAYWASPFKVADTHNALFHPAGGGQQTVPFMAQAQHFPYSRATGWSAVELPYASSTLAMLVVLPGPEGLGALERRLTPGLLGRVTAALRPRLVGLEMPRFHISLSTSLVKPLMAMGVTRAFTEAAQFPAISDVPLKLGEVLHAADIRVTEAGTEAAASTVVGAEPTAAEIPSATFVADRPFLFFVRDTRTGAILFSGRVTDAAQAQA